MGLGWDGCAVRYRCLRVLRHCTLCCGLSCIIIICVHSRTKAPHPTRPPTVSQLLLASLLSAVCCWCLLLSTPVCCCLLPSTPVCSCLLSVYSCLLPSTAVCIGVVYSCLLPSGVWCLVSGVWSLGLWLVGLRSRTGFSWGSERVGLVCWEMLPATRLVFVGVLLLPLILCWEQPGSDDAGESGSGCSCA